MVLLIPNFSLEWLLRNEKEHFLFLSGAERSDTLTNFFERSGAERKKKDIALSGAER